MLNGQLHAMVQQRNRMVRKIDTDLSLTWLAKLLWLNLKYIGLRLLRFVLADVWLFIADIPRQWRAKTPRIAKYIRNVAAMAAAAVPIVKETLQSSGTEAPAWFTDNLWIFIVAFAVITVAAGTKEDKKNP